MRNSPFVPRLTLFCVWYFYSFNLSGVKKLTKKQTLGSLGTSQTSLVYLCFSLKWAGVEIFLGV